MWVHSQDIISYNKIFNNKEFGQIRTVEIDGKPYFVGKDVANALGYSNPRDALRRHCKGVVKRDTLTDGGMQQLSFLPEGDVYRLIVHSKLPSAERFESWVFDDVLPSIRKTGGYVNENSGASSLTPLLIYVNAMWFKSEDIANYLSDLL